MSDLYEAYRYAADGQAGEEGDGDVICTGTLDECRAAIRKVIGPYFADTACPWDGGDEDVEAYNESAEEGCGGYAIRPVPDAV